jgi:hypothetical protein
VLLLGVKDLPQAMPLAGIGLHVDMTPGLYITLLSLSGYTNYATTPLPLPAGIGGARVFAQYLYANTSSCGGAGTYCASDALEIVVQ